MSLTEARRERNWASMRCVFSGLAWLEPDRDLKRILTPRMSWIEHLPHQPPMRLLEDVVDVKHGESATGRRLTRADDFYFQGHFPGHPVVPAIGPFKFPAAAGSGMALEARARVAGRIGGLFKIEGIVTADGVVVAAGSLTLAG